VTFSFDTLTTIKILPSTTEIPLAKLPKAAGAQ
jgi:hypothetical protein